MSLTIESAFFVMAAFAFLLYLGYHYKNIYMTLSAGILAIIFAVMIWFGGIVEETGAVFVSDGMNIVSTSTFTQINFGFSQSFIALFFILLGLFLFLQGIGALFEKQWVSSGGGA